MHKIELIRGDSIAETYPVSWTDDVDQIAKIAEQLRVDKAASGWRIIDQVGRLIIADSAAR